MRTNEYESVCAGCFEDPGIRAFIDKHDVQAKCSFCLGISDLDAVAPFEQVVEHVRTCLFHEYDDATDWMVLDSDTKEPMNVYYDSWDILEHVKLQLPRDDDGRLFQALALALSDDWWSESNPFGISSQDQVRVSWSWFCEVVKHQRRFFFGDYDDGLGLEFDSPSHVLTKIFDYANSIGLVTSLPENAVLFRTRVEDPCNLLQSQDELGPPPRELATKPNRMSPPGIPMLYASDDIDTAFKETAECYGFYAVGRFKTNRAAKILDLTKIPPIPSVFQCESGHFGIRARDALIFLDHVVNEMSIPVAKGDKAHIDYVPTQVVTEFVRSVQDVDYGGIDGIKYPSAVRIGGSSYVIFDTCGQNPPQNSEVRGTPTDSWLVLTDVTHHYVSREWLFESPDPGSLHPPFRQLRLDESSH